MHAKRQYVQFFADRQLQNVDRLHLRMNALLPPDARVLCVRAVPSTFSVRYHALSREYHYRLQYGDLFDPLQRKYVWFVPGDLDVPAMEHVAACMEGTHDFEAFSNARPDYSDFKRTLYSVKLVQLGDGHIRFEVCAAPYLSKQLRHAHGASVSAVLIAHVTTSICASGTSGVIPCT